MSSGIAIVGRSSACQSGLTVCVYVRHQSAAQAGHVEVLYQGAASVSLLARSRSVAGRLWWPTASCLAIGVAWRSIMLRRSSFRSRHD